VVKCLDGDGVLEGGKVYVCPYSVIALYRYAYEYATANMRIFVHVDQPQVLICCHNLAIQFCYIVLPQVQNLYGIAILF
jgi:hypothetical protein